MPTTTNYGWTTPADTDLVKDGAAAIRTLGTSADTTVKNLNPETTLGDIAYRSSTSNVNTRLGIGSTGQVLTVAGGVPSWATPAGGGMTLISETVASAQSSLSFSSISGSYKQLLLLWNGIYHSGTGSYFAIRLNNNSTSATYLGSSIDGKGTTVAARGMYQDSINNNASYSFGENANFSSIDLNATVNGSLLIDNYASTTKYKHFNCSFGYYNNSTVTYSYVKMDGVFCSTSAITSIDIVRLAGSATFTNATNTTIRLYGVS